MGNHTHDPVNHVPFIVSPDLAVSVSVSAERPDQTIIAGVILVTLYPFLGLKTPIDFTSIPLLQIMRPAESFTPAALWIGSPFAALNRA